MQIRVYVPMLMYAFVLKDASPCFADGEPSNPYRCGNRNNITERNTGKGWE